jgi:hypothetical protein
MIGYFIIDYKIESIKILSPIIFCMIFKLPLFIGVVSGIINNHIVAN